VATTAPERAPLQGTKAMSRINDESEPLMRRASKSLSVCGYRINSNEHDTEHGVRSEAEQPLAKKQRDEPWAYCISTGQLRENKGESVSGAEWRRAKRAEVQRRRTVSTDINVRNTAHIGEPTLLGASAFASG